MGNKNIGIFCCLVTLTTGCATQLTTDAKRVRIVSAEQKSACQFLQIISAEVRLGPDKPGNVLRQALNQVAVLGGDGLYVISQTVDWAEGAAVTGEALQCKVN